MIRGKLGVLFLVLAMGGCASTPEPVAQIDTRLAGYFTQSPLDEGGREAALRVGVGVVPSEAIGAQDESTRLGMIAAVRADPFVLSRDHVRAFPINFAKPDPGQTPDH